MLIFSLLAVVIVLNYENYGKPLAKLRSHRPQERPYFRADGLRLGMTWRLRFRDHGQAPRRRIGRPIGSENPNRLARRRQSG